MKDWEKVGREEDKERLLSMPTDDLMNLVFAHIRNLWAVDGLYFLGIEKRFGTEAAVEIDREVWERMAATEVRRLREALGVEGKGLKHFMDMLLATSWALDLEDKELYANEREGELRNTDCRVQRTRLSKGLDEFPCKPVRFGYLREFARAFDPNIRVECIVCPPDEHPDDLWCEWRFSLRKTSYEEPK